LESSQGLYNGLLGNVVFLDRKGISRKIIEVLENQVTDLENSINQILDADGIPAPIKNNFIEPFLDDNIKNLRDIIKFIFEGNAKKNLFTNTNNSNNQNQFEALRKSDFKGVFSYFPLTQIYSPNKDLLYENLNYFEEKSDEFSNNVALHMDNKFSYLYTNPLKITLSFMNSLHIFIKVLLINIVMVLGIINVIIIYSLTSLAVNEKNFEFGIIRALGLPKAGLLKLIGNL
jgi:ABC-type antimicrobial peptide transport system permease subunit